MRAHPLLMLMFGVLLTADLVVLGHTEYGVTVQVAKTAALEQSATYAWISTHPSPIKIVDAQIVAAVDRELRARGFTKVPSNKSDLLATYASVSRTDVDVHAKADASGVRRSYLVGTLVVDLRDPHTNQPLFRVRVDQPIETDSSTSEAEINAAVTAMFAKYPARARTKRSR